MSEVAVVKIQTTPARLLMKTIPAKLTIEVEKGGWRIKKNPMKLEINNKDFFDSIGVHSRDYFTQEGIERGKENVVEYMQKCAIQKNALMGPHRKNIAEVISEINKNKAAQKIATSFSVTQPQKPEIEWSGGDLDIEYIKDILHISWTRAQILYQFIPPSVKYTYELREKGKFYINDND